MKQIFTFSILLVLFFNQNCFAQWHRIKSIDDYAVLCIESYNGIVYAGCDDGGVFISPDNGRNWLKSYKGLPKGSFESIAISDNRIFILSRGNGIYASTDNGETWTSKNSGLPDKYNSFLAINGSYLCTISSEGILISKDYGDTWTKKNNPSNKEITAIAFNENILYMGTNGAGLFLSSDLGDTWLANKELPFKDISAMSFSGNKIFASRSLTNSIYLTTNGGANWNGMGYINSQSDIISMKANGNNFFVLTNIDGIIKSTDNGVSWENTILNGMRNINCFTINKDIIYCGLEGDGILLSKDNGLTQEESVGAEVDKMSSLEIYDGTLYAGTIGDGLIYSKDNGEKWILGNTPLNWEEINCLAINKNHIFCGTTFKGVYLTTDYGNSWIAKNKGLTDTIIDAIACKGDSIFVSTFQDGISLSTDNGDNWIPKNNGLPEKYITLIKVLNNDIYTVMGGGIYYSSDLGENWIPKNNNGLIGSGIVDFDIDNNNFLITYKSSVFISSDCGDNWKELSVGSFVYKSGKISGKNIFVGSSIFGMFLSTDLGLTWTAINQGFEEISVLKVSVLGKTVFATTRKGIYKADLSDFGIVNVKEVRYQNDEFSVFPNPANNELNINLNQLSIENIQIEIFDMLGQSVYESQIPAGTHEWKVKLETLPKGIYLVKINNSLQKVIKL